MKILMVLTSNDRMGDSGNPTGFWLEEFAAPYYTFVDAGAEVTLASPRGGQPPVDPMSEDESALTEATRRFEADEQARAALASTRRLADCAADAHDALFFPGGHGPLWDLAYDPDCQRLIEAFDRMGKPIGAVCHGPAVFCQATGSDGNPLVSGRKVTGFTDSEEKAVGLTEVVPFSIETRFGEQGARFDRDDDFTPFAVVDGRLVTGQNPQSSALAAERLVDLLPAAKAA